MSFILDALKKSESDRQRQSGPALFEVKVTPPRPRFPYWALALAVLLVINIAVGAWVFLHRQPPAAAQDDTAATSTSPAPQSAPPQAAPAAAAAVPAVATASALAAPAPAAAPARTSAGQPEPVLSNSDAKDASVNPDDYEPAVPPGKQSADQAEAHVRSGTESGLKNYADAAANPDAHLPALRVDLHVYAAKPEERFVLINMHRLHEGETLPEGVRVESITPEGVVVSYQGAKFILEHE
jgi:general secretion pathway protein B